MLSRVLAGLVVALGVLALVWGAFSGPDDAAESALATNDGSDASVEPLTLAEAPENFGPRKNLIDLDGWLNTDITSFDELDGQVVMVEMWTFGCSNCKARIPHTQELYATYADRGFEIVGVHAPEFDYEAEVPNIEEAIERLGVTWPVALDTDKKNFRAWQEGGRRFWPRTYVIDQNGDIRYDHIGEGKYDELAQTVGWLLDNPPAPSA